MKRKLNIANAVTASRIIFAVLLVFSSAFSIQFYTFYLLGAFTDMIDGTIARKLNMKSSFGALLDSVADCIFVVAVLIKIVFALCLPKWLWAWIAIIACIKSINLVLSLWLFHRLAPMHTKMNKVAGFMLFLLPFGIDRGSWQASATAIVVTGLVATFAAIQEGYYIRTGKKIE